MFIVIGYKAYNKRLGFTRELSKCSSCQKEVHFQVTEAQTKFTFFWIPLFKVRTSYFLSCPSCGTSSEISSERYEEIKSSLITLSSINTAIFL